MIKKEVWWLQGGGEWAKVEEGMIMEKNTIKNELLEKKKNATLSFATTWMDWEGIMLNEVSQTEEDEYHIISLICGIYKTK